MRFWVCIVFLFAAPAVLCAAPALAAQTAAPNLPAARQAIKNPWGSAAFDEQIAGRAPKGALSARLPAGLTRKDILALLAPGVDAKQVIFVGATAWPSVANRTIAIVCAARSAKEAQARQGPPACEGRPEVILGLLAYRPGGKAPRLLARTRPGFVLDSNWGGAPALTPSLTPSDPGSASATGKAKRPDEEVAGFDFAPYRIAPAVLAFGLRSDLFEGYSGGFGLFQTLHLFVVDGHRLRRILVQPIYAMTMTAGDWNPDGTRQHVISESTIALVIAPTMTHGRYAIDLRELGAQGRARLVWSPSLGAYKQAPGRR